ncbi:MAG TPA: LamG-like jellyroll fold domain-containing protein, partial [Opitutaceae bacterium]|nr:LamG-like jellyroll fold domain-containing protein [Opitutaceae bacterium]
MPPLPRLTSCLHSLSALLAVALLAGPSARAADSAEPGLLFYLSGEKGTTPDFSAAGTTEPNFVAEITKIPDGAKGAALSCGDLQKLAYTAPGNIYAQRGTLSFFWRSRYAVGATPFPVFRVGYADHSSWDMVWLRIDYNGHGFDAFVTDASLSRTRVSIDVQPFPKPNEWTHLALSWDETRGIRFYVNGKLAGKVETTAVYNAGLDQFGPHSRVISPYQVQSDYNFVRGGDVDEIRIYDRMLADANITTLAQGNAPTSLPPLPGRSLADSATRDEWLMRYGWNRPNDPAPELPAGPSVAIRKVEIHDAYDIKRWWWKATDGIRETTWPGVYNRSRLPGRHDYFTLPDWDCYVDSGKAVTFGMPNEPWNHLEISGAAWGKMELLKPGAAMEDAYAAPAQATLFERPKGQEKTVHTLASHTGGQIRFTNVDQEQPIGELSAYNVTAGAEPAGSTKLAFRLAKPTPHLPASSDFAGLPAYIAGRFAPDERAALVAQPADQQLPLLDYARIGNTLPIVHVIIPDTWDQLTDGLDGIALDLPALKATPTQGGRIALNIQVKDPLWQKRDMLDFTFSVQPGQAKKLWLDLRDRLLPAGKPLYITVTSASPDFNELSLFGAEVRLVFKPRDAARPEHELDRFTQAKDSYAMLVEEHPNNPKYDLWNRFKGDLQDLLRVNPNHPLGVLYAAAAIGGARPAFTQPAAPSGVPLWAFRQTELLGRVKRFVDWYIDHRQSGFGDFGGGISDDVDLLNTWPGVALMGSDPDKIKVSLNRLLDAAFKNGMFTNGLPTIQADELHSYEEGINCLAQNLILDYGSPRQIERAMDTARGVETLTGVNAAGHRHIMTSFYSGTKMATDDPWGRSKPYSNLVLQVPQLLVDYNGNPEAKKYLLELADGLLAHRHVDASGNATLATTIVFATDREADATRGFFPWHVFWGAWKWTGDHKYLDPILDGGPLSALS